MFNFRPLISAVLIVLLIVLCAPALAQDVEPDVTPEPTPEVTPEPTVAVQPVIVPEETEAAPVIVVEVPDDHTEETVNTTIKTLQNIILGLMVLVTALVALAIKLGIDVGKAFRESKPLQLGFTGAVNLARFTTSPEDDKKLAEALNKLGYEVDSSGPIWTIKPKAESAVG